MIAHLVKNSWDQLKHDEKETEVRKNTFIMYDMTKL